MCQNLRSNIILIPCKIWATGLNLTSTEVVSLPPCGSEKTLTDGGMVNAKMELSPPDPEHWGALLRDNLICPLILCTRRMWIEYFSIKDDDCQQNTCLLTINWSSVSALENFKGRQGILPVLVSVSRRVSCEVLTRVDEHYVIDKNSYLVSIWKRRPGHSASEIDVPHG